MTFSASILPVDNDGIRDRWSNLESSSAVQTPFSNLGYVEDLAAVSDTEVRALFIQNDGDVAGILLMMSKRLGIPYVSPAGFTPYSAIAAKSLPLPARMHKRESWLDAMIMCLDQGFGKLDLILPPAMTDLRPFQWARWNASPLYTFQLDLGDPDKTIRGWSEGARRSFSRMKDSYELRCSESSANDIVRLCLDSYERQHRTPPLPPDQLKDLVHRQISRKAAACYTLHALGGDEAEAGLVVLGAPPDAYYWVAGSLPGPSMTVLVGRLIHELSNKGYHHFDLVGANTPSIAEFKRRLNPALVPYFRVRHVSNRILRVILNIKEAIRQ